MSSRCGVFLPVVLALLVGTGWSAGARADTTVCERAPSDKWLWDPCPAADAAQQELRLPLPGGRLFLVLRAVDVPGNNFWCDGRRNVALGHDDPGDPFAGVQRIQVGGAFRTGSGASAGWRYYVGKYEFTFGQAAAVLGNGDLRRGVKQLLDMLQSDPGGAELAKPVIQALSSLPASDDASFWAVLGEPARALTQSEIAALLQRLNSACFQDAACAAVLRDRASLAGVPGFVRLPTEVEWEYAARGGGRAVDDGSFRADTVWLSADQHSRYAVSKSYPKWPGIGPQRIGGERLAAPGGLYDTLGNASELTADVFGTDLRQGRGGGLSARGGSRSDEVARLTYAARSEVPLYRWDRPAGASDPATPLVYRGLHRDTQLGFRPVLVSVNRPTGDFTRLVDKDFATECRAVGGLRGPATEAKKAAEAASKIELAPGSSPDVTKRLSDVRMALASTRSELDLAGQRLCRNVFTVAYNTARAVMADIADRDRNARIAESAHELFEELHKPEDETRWKTNLGVSDKYRHLADIRIVQYDESVRDAANYPAECSDRVANDVLDSLMKMGAWADERDLVSTVRQHIEAVRSRRRLTLDQIKQDVAATRGKTW